jgi:hypothetical protein
VFRKPRNWEQPDISPAPQEKLRKTYSSTVFGNPCSGAIP